MTSLLPIGPIQPRPIPLPACARSTRRPPPCGQPWPGAQAELFTTRGKHSIRQTPASLNLIAMEAIQTAKERPLNTHDLLHVRAAECWLALGNLDEANREVENIRPRS